MLACLAVSPHHRWLLLSIPCLFSSSPSLSRPPPPPFVNTTVTATDRLCWLYRHHRICLLFHSLFLPLTFLKNGRPMSVTTFLVFENFGASYAKCVQVSKDAFSQVSSFCLMKLMPQHFSSRIFHDTFIRIKQIHSWIGTRLYDFSSNSKTKIVQLEKIDEVAVISLAGYEENVEQLQVMWEVVIWVASGTIT